MAKPKREQIRPIDIARFVKFTAPPADIRKLAHDLKAYTWESGRECAVVKIHRRGFAVVTGGSQGIAFRLRESSILDSQGARTVYPTLEINGQPMRVDELVCHTHPPPPTGPSKADFEMLKVLNQSQSIIFEINGDPDGVVFRLLQKRGDT